MPEVNWCDGFSVWFSFCRFALLPIFSDANLRFCFHLAQDSLNEYLQYACPVELTRKNPEVCTTHPQHFLWPSERFFAHYRPQ